MGIGEIIGCAIGIILFISGVITWGIRLEGKVKTQQDIFTDFRTDIKEDINHISENIEKLFGKVEEVMIAVEYQRGRANGKKNRG